MSAPALHVHHITHAFDQLPVLADVSVTVQTGEFVSLLGPSGSGKSTLFWLIAGIMEPDEGRIFVDGADVTGQPGHVGLMPQRDLLLPWRTLLDNAILALEVEGVPRSEARTRARALVPEFGLAGFEDAYPSALSGGMRQRAALLRTVLPDHHLLLLDEPFGALDALTRAAMQQWLQSVWADLHRSVLFITHDIDEAIFLSDRIYVFSPLPGQIALELPVDLPRPRQYDLVTSPEFAALKACLLDTLRPSLTLSREASG